jgi:hypothetical protein
LLSCAFAGADSSPAKDTLKQKMDMTWEKDRSIEAPDLKEIVRATR